jgi:hypothetical protein
MGGDGTLGRKLVERFAEAGLPEPEAVVTLHLKHGEARLLPYLTLDFARAGIVDGGIATDADVDAALADLERQAEDDSALIGGPRIFQLWVTKPG